jgi:RimJ/RimL family protein N-acetyltransferase
MDNPAQILVHGEVELRRWRAADAPRVYQIVTASLDHLRPWLPFAAGFDRAKATQLADRFERDWESDGAYNYAITTRGAVVGSCGLIRRIGPGGLEVGYWLHPAHTGRGLATMAVRALVEQAFALPDVERVEIVHDTANTPSAGVPRRLGFIELGRRASPPETLTPGEAGVDIVWRLTRDAWRPTPQSGRSRDQAVPDR